MMQQWYARYRQVLLSLRRNLENSLVKRLEKVSKTTLTKNSGRQETRASCVRSGGHALSFVRALRLVLCLDFLNRYIVKFFFFVGSQYLHVTIPYFYCCVSDSYALAYEQPRIPAFLQVPGWIFAVFDVKTKFRSVPRLQDHPP
jgi:hypothetical protein